MFEVVFGEVLVVVTVCREWARVGVCAAGSVFWSAGCCAGEDDELLCHADHVEECGHPVGIVFETFGADHCGEVFVWVVEVLAGADDIYSWSVG